MSRIFTTYGAAALAAALFTSGAMAADENGRYAPDVPGTVVCRTMNAYDADSDQAKVLAGFAAGYTSAHSKLMEGVFDITPWQTPEYVMLQVRRYCEENPEMRFSQALDAYLRFIEEDALSASAPMRPVTNGSQTVLMYEETINAAQAALNDLGFTSKTGLEGLAAFQAARGLPVTGLPDQSTLALLFGG